jgi:hypothetical protein
LDAYNAFFANAAFKPFVKTVDLWWVSFLDVLYNEWLG